MRPATILGLVLALLGTPTGADDREGTPRPDMKRLYDAVRDLVRRHYPEATAHLVGNKIHFEQRTRVFLVHLPLKTGEWQDPIEMRGPEEGKVAAEKPEAKTVTVRGTVVDDETGKPIERLITQAGKFDPAVPAKVTWGYSEGRSSARDGSVSTTVRWAEGWTARILADGYIPQPVISTAPPADKSEIVVTIRLKRGRAVQGEVLDHAGKPVKAASVFAIGPTGLNLAAGKAWSSWGEPNDEARPVLTDEAGRFELPAGAAKALAVSYPGFDAWPVPIPAEAQVVVHLPKPARVDVEFNVEGAPREGTLFYQLLSHLTPEFAGLQSSRTLPIANGGVLSLPALPPGKYQICRQVMNRLGDVGIGAMVDREFFELEAGETRSIRWVREKGARLRGKVILPKDVKLSGIMVSVMSEKAERDPFEKHEWQTTHASQTTAADGSFVTERIAKGRYRLVASAYTPLTDTQRMSTGLVGPAFQVETTIDVPASGELAVPDLELRPIKAR